jgi:calcineurin-like phosphoesterase family protein
MNIWVTTDTHFSHKLILEKNLRPSNFEDKIKKGLLNCVKEGDLLIHLGDVCLGNDIENHNWFKKNLHCKTYLIRGNHDRKSMGWYLGNGWDSVSERLDINLFGKRICFTHIPIPEDGNFDINLHGHFHNTNHRRNEPRFNEILTEKHKLIALEYVNYLPLKLNKIISSLPPTNLTK